MPFSTRTLAAQALPLVTVAVLAFAVSGLYLNSRISPVDLALPISVDSQGNARQGNTLVGRLTPAGELSIPLVTPNNADQPVNTQVEIDFDQSQAEEQVTPTFISIQGTSTLYSSWLDERRLTLQIVDIVPDSYTAVSLQADPGFFTPGLLVRFERWLGGLNPNDGPIAAGLILLVLSGYSVWISRSPLKTGRQSTPTPPADLRPIQLAILHHGGVGPADLIALLFDLAERGYLQIIQGPHGILFLRTATVEGLTDYERGLLALLFATNQTSHLEDILASLDKDLFSAAVNQIYLEIYDGFQTQGYFAENPRFTHLRIKTLAIGVQFAGLLYAALGATLLSSFSVILWAGVGLYLGGVALYWAGGHTLSFSALGKSYLGECSKFLGYLADSQHIGQEGTQGILLFQLMPFALAGRRSHQWLERFRHTSCSVPQWYSTQDEAIVEPLLFLRRIENTVKSISKDMASLKDPNVE